MRERPVRLILGYPACLAGLAMAFVNAVFDQNWTTTGVGLALAAVGGGVTWSGYREYRRNDPDRPKA